MDGPGAGGHSARVVLRPLPTRAWPPTSCLLSVRRPRGRRTWERPPGRRFGSAGPGPGAL